MTWSDKLWKEESPLPAQDRDLGENTQNNEQSGWFRYLGHEDVFSTKAVVRIGVIVKDLWDRAVGMFAQEIHSRNFRLRFDSGHESARNPCDKFKAIDKGDDISLDRHQRRTPGARV